MPFIRPYPLKDLYFSFSKNFQFTRALVKLTDLTVNTYPMQITKSSSIRKNTATTSYTFCLSALSSTRAWCVYVTIHTPTAIHNLKNLTSKNTAHTHVCMCILPPSPPTSRAHAQRSAPKRAPSVQFEFASSFLKCISPGLSSSFDEKEAVQTRFSSMRQRGERWEERRWWLRPDRGKDFLL